MNAPKINHSIHKVVWSDEGILAYQSILSTILPQLESENATEAGSASVLFQLTNSILTSAAKMTNKSVELGKPPKERKASIPFETKAAIKHKQEDLTILRAAVADNANEADKNDARTLSGRKMLKNMCRETPSSTKSCPSNLGRYSKLSSQ